MTNKEVYKKLLAKGELGKAISELLEATELNGQKDLHSNLILLSGQYNNNEKDNNRGLLERDVYQRAKARISYAMTAYIDEYEPSSNTPTEPASQPRTQQYHYGSGDNVGGNKIVHHYTDAQQKTPSPKAKEKILFIAANPTDAGKLQTDKEHRIIKDAMRRGKHRDKYEFLQPLLSVTIQELIQAVNDKPEILHFSGHGENKGVIITTENNKMQLLPIRPLKRMFKRLKNHTRLVLLNSCYSASQAKEISTFGMYVVGYNLPIGDLAAIGFAQGLYIGLGEGKSFEEAFDDAMIVLETQAPDYADRVEVWKDGEQLDL